MLMVSKIALKTNELDDTSILEGDRYVCDKILESLANGTNSSKDSLSKTQLQRQSRYWQIKSTDLKVTVAVEEEEVEEEVAEDTDH